MESCPNRNGQMYNPQQSCGNPNYKRSSIGPSNYTHPTGVINHSYKESLTDFANQAMLSDDPMATLGKDFPVGMCYVPWQNWDELYPTHIALTEGTIFKDLNKIFCGVRC